MSLWSSIAKFGRKVISSPLLKAVPGLGTAATVGSIAATMYKGGSAATKAVRAIPGKGLIAASAGGAVVGSALTHDGMRKRRRRINPANARAAKRAIRRIKATHKLLKDIEKQMPHKVVHRRS